MTKIPSHRGKQMVAALKKAEFRVDRQEGDHVVLVKEGIARPVIVPLWEDLPAFIISNNLRTAGLSRKEYVELLKGRRRGRKR